MTAIDRNRKSATAMLWIGLLTLFTLLLTKPAQSYNPPPCEPPQEGCPPNTYWDSDACFCVPCPAKTWSAGAPITVSVSGASEVETCKTISISASASDSDSYTRSPCTGGSSADNITYYWTVQNGTIVGSNTGASITFKAGGSCGAASASVTVGDVGVPHQYSDSSVNKTHNFTVIPPDESGCGGHTNPTYLARDPNVTVGCYEAFGGADIDFDWDSTADFDFDACLEDCQWGVDVTTLRVRSNIRICDCNWITNPGSKELYCIWNCQLSGAPNWDIDDGNCASECVEDHEDYHATIQLAYAFTLVNTNFYFDGITANISCDDVDTSQEAKTALMNAAKEQAIRWYVEVRVKWSQVDHCYAYIEETPCLLARLIYNSHTDPDPGESCETCNETNYPALSDNPYYPCQSQ